MHCIVGFNGFMTAVDTGTLKNLLQLFSKVPYSGLGSVLGTLISTWELPPLKVRLKQMHVKQKMKIQTLCWYRNMHACSRSRKHTLLSVSVQTRSRI